MALHSKLCKNKALKMLHFNNSLSASIVKKNKGLNFPYSFSYNFCSPRCWFVQDPPPPHTHTHTNTQAHTQITLKQQWKMNPTNLHLNVTYPLQLRIDACWKKGHFIQFRHIPFLLTFFPLLSVEFHDSVEMVPIMVTPTNYVHDCVVTAVHWLIDVLSTSFIVGYS